MVTDEMVSKAAVAMCLKGGFDPYEAMPNDGPRWKYYVDGARAALEAALSAAEPVAFEGQNYNCPCVHPSQCDESCLKPAPSVAVKALRTAIHNGLIDGARLESDLQSEFDRTVDSILASVSAALSAQVQDVAVAEIVSAHGDPEAFGERELVALIDIQKFPYRTKLYAAAPAVKQGEVE